MKGLLLKDFYVLFKNCRVFMVLILVFIAVSLFGDDNWFFIIYPCLFAGMFPMTLIAYDERSGWSHYCGTLPYTRAQLVSVKYTVGLLINAVILLLIALVQVAKGANELDRNALTGLLTCAGAIGLVSPALLLPFVFRFGSEKGRIAYYIVIGAICAGSVILFSGERISGVLGGQTAWLMLGGAAIALYAGSWLLSVALYQNREV